MRIDVGHQDLQTNIWTNPAPGSIPESLATFTDTISKTTPHNYPWRSCDTRGGISGAVGNNGIGVVGVNWNVRLMSLRFLGPSGGTTANAIRACSYAKQMRDLWISSGGTQGANIRALNNSYGGGGFSQSFLDTINALNDSGILFIASAGNDGADTDVFPQYPGSYSAPNLITVVATDSSDLLGGLSNFGKQRTMLGAPGISILSTETANSYGSLSGTSMAAPHVTGAAALLCAASPNLNVQQLKSLLLFNGDVLAALSGKTLTGRRLNVAKSLQALAENDTVAPGTVANFQLNTQSGRNLNLGWTTSGDDGASGQASLYQLTFTDANSNTVTQLTSFVPPASGTPQTINVKIPYRHTNGTLMLHELDNVGNEGIPASLNVAISVVDGDPFIASLGGVDPLSVGGTPLGLTFDDRYLENYSLPFVFPYFGQTYNTVTISTNGNLYFSTPPKRPNGDADDVPSSLVNLKNYKMIDGLWDDLYLGTDHRADADVYLAQPDANTIIFRWQGVACNAGPSGSCQFGGPINFEIELRSNGRIHFATAPVTQTSYRLWNFRRRRRAVFNSDAYVYGHTH